MKFTRCAMGLALLAASLCAPALAADAYPTKSIRLLLGFPPGGGSDSFARLMASEMSKTLGQTVFVENRAGANGVIAATQLARATPDGYTLMIALSSHIMNAFSYKNLPYDTLKDFTPISALASTPYVLTANLKFGPNTVKELIADAKARPGKINYGSAGNGSIPHLYQALMDERAGIDLAHIPYNGAAPALTDLLGGQVDMLMQSTVQSLPLLKSGKLKALAITSAKRSPALPEVPTIAESGVAGYDAEMWWGLLAPPALPAAIQKKLQDSMVGIMRSPEVKSFLATQGATAMGTTAEEFAAIMKDEYAKWQPLFERGIVKPE